MRSSSTRVLLIAALTAISAGQVAAIEKNYASAVVREFQEKARDKVLYYLYNTPVMQEEPYFEISIEMGGSVLVGEYTPEYSGESLPSDWKAGRPVKVRLEKHFFYVQRAQGGEVKFRISDRYTPKSETRR